MKTVIFMRKKRSEANSIEEIFYPLKPYLGESVEIIELPYSSSSIWNIFRNILFARKHRGDVNHISGEVHYLGIGLGKRSILTIHDLDTILQGSIIKKAIKRFIWFTLPLKMVGKVTCISNSTFDELIKEFPSVKSKTRIIYNPVHAKFPQF